MSIQPRTRKEDEELLQWLQWRDEGFDCGQIGKHCGVSATRVRVATNRVRKESDE
nr:hypothetical protein [uncultured Roseovarius sp.]